jgi:hypothetical protein
LIDHFEGIRIGWTESNNLIEVIEKISSPLSYCSVLDIEPNDQSMKDNQTPNELAIENLNQVKCTSSKRSKETKKNNKFVCLFVCFRFQATD